MRNYRLHASACRLLGCVSRVPGLKCGRCMPILAAQPSCLCRPATIRNTSTIMKLFSSRPKWPPFHLNTLVHGAWLREKGLCPKSGYREVPRDPARSQTPCTYRSTSHGNREIPRSPQTEFVWGRIGKSKDASREDATAGVRSVCDRPAAVAWRRETGNVQFSWLHAYLREEEEQRTVHGVAADDPQKVANETEGGENRTSEADARTHPRSGQVVPRVGPSAFSYSVGIPE
jgi:hypothetical protein